VIKEPTKQTETEESKHRNARQLIRQVAKLCALANIPEEKLAAELRDVYKKNRFENGLTEPSENEALVAAQVLGEWYENSRFLNSSALPKQLSIKAGEFKSLCEIADLRAEPKRILQLLQDSGAVSIESDLVSPICREFIPNREDPAAVGRAIGISSEFTSTLTKNVTRNNKDTALFERTVVSEKLTPRNMSSLLAYLNVHGQSFLEDLDAWMTSREEADEGFSVGVGVYLFINEGTNNFQDTDAKN
jgi:hypothetical protein